MNNDELRVLERASITSFVAASAPMLDGKKVLDYGCGKQPYRELIERAGADYYGFDRESFPSNISEEDIGADGVLSMDWDVILSTQTIQFVAPWDLHHWLHAFRSALYLKRGVLLMTGPTTWPLVEPADICRYTPNGMKLILDALEYEAVSVEPRASFSAGSVGFVTGWAAVARARL